MTVERLTGRSRLRIAIAANGAHLVVLQVEVGTHNTPCTHWRDARVEDLSRSDITPALKVAP